ncbi:hypothetical protein [Ferrovibrio sp.]|uniref:hypothetical protein n=1 Tax=Ferrovibrio sp. TaxID=1917215 RepID=UPI003D2DD9FF
MEKITTTLTDMLSVGWVGSVLGIVGLIVAGLTYLGTRQRIKLAYCHMSQRLLGHKDDGLPEGITVQYHGANIPRLSRSILVVWNEGEKTIQRTDLVENDPLRINVGADGKILTATVLKVTRDVNRISFDVNKSEPHELHIDFDFIDQNDGAVIELLHTSEKPTAKLTGTVRGLPRGISNYGVVRTQGQFQQKSRLFTFIQLKVFAYIAIAFGCAFAVFAYMDIEPPKDPFTGRLFFVVAAPAYILLGAILVWLLRRKHPKTLSIEEL